VGILIDSFVFVATFLECASESIFKINRSIFDEVMTKTR